MGFLVRGCQRTISVSFLRCHSSFFFFFLRQDFSVAWNLPIRLFWLATESQRSTCPSLLCTGITSIHLAFFYVGRGIRLRYPCFWAKHYHFTFDFKSWGASSGEIKKTVWKKGFILTIIRDESQRECKRALKSCLVVVCSHQDKWEIEKFVYRNRKQLFITMLFKVKLVKATFPKLTEEKSEVLKAQHLFLPLLAVVK